MTVVVRLAMPADADALAALKLRTFRETFLDGFAIPYPPVDLAVFEQATYSAATVAQELADPRKHSWLAERDGVLLGYAHVMPSKLPHPEVTAMSGELSQIYVKNAAQGMGIGRVLLDTALAAINVHFPGPIWLGVWSGNLKAQAMYQARGFRKVGDYQFVVGNWRDDELIYRRD